MKWLLFILISLVCISSVYSLDLFVRPKTVGGGLQPNTPFTYRFAFSGNDDCTDIFFNHTESIVTDESGVAYIYILTSNISEFPAVLCEYKGAGDGNLRKIHNFSDLILRSLQVGTINVTNITAEIGWFDYIGDAARKVIQGFFVDIQAETINVTNMTTETLIVSSSANITGGLTIDDDLIIGNINISGTSTKIGIGTLTPTSELHVIGNANITGNVSTTFIDFDNTFFKVNATFNSTTNTMIVTNIYKPIEV